MSTLFSAFDSDTALVHPTKRQLDLLFDAFDEEGEGELHFHDWVRLVRAALIAKEQMGRKNVEVTVPRDEATQRATDFARQCDWGFEAGQQHVIRKENFRIAMDGPLLEKLLTTPIIQLMLHKRLADALVKHQACMHASIDADCERASLEATTASATSDSAVVLAATEKAVDLAAGTVRRYDRMYEATMRGLTERRAKFYGKVDACVDKLVAALDTVQGDEELKRRRKQKIHEAQRMRQLPTIEASDMTDIERPHKKRSLGSGSSTAGTPNANDALGAAFNSRGRSNAPETNTP